MQMPRIAALLAVLATSAFAQQPLNLGVGTQKTLHFPGIQRVALGDDVIADVKTLGNSELLVIGLKAGHTTLQVWRTGQTTPERFNITISGPGTAAAPGPNVAADTTPPPSFSPTLKVGEKTMKPVANLQRVAIGDPAIADLTTGAGSLTLEGLTKGQTNVLLWFADGHREQWLVTVVK
jgi:Flp pilus assembly secretin CpaC